MRFYGAGQVVTMTCSFCGELMEKPHTEKQVFYHARPMKADGGHELAGCEGGEGRVPGVVG